MLDRLDYWFRIIIMSIALFIGLFVYALILPLMESMANVMGSSSLFVYLPILVTGIVLIMVQWVWAIQRFHDVGLSGLWLFLIFLPFIGNLSVFFILCLPSNTFTMYNG